MHQRFMKNLSTVKFFFPAAISKVYFSFSRLTIDGCQVDYQCFDFQARHHNVIRFRKGVAMIMKDFQTVCSWVQFKNDVEWKYDLMLSMISTHLFHFKSGPQLLVLGQH